MRDSGRTRRSDVAKVICFYNTDPFRSFDAAGDLNVEGFEVTVVLWSGKTGRGIAEDGVIRVKMYRVDSVGRQKSRRTFVREWNVDTTGLPVFTAALFGDGYKLKFQWAAADDILGHNIQLVVSFDAPDGRTIQSQTKSLRVPRAKD